MRIPRYLPPGPGAWDVPGNAVVGMMGSVIMMLGLQYTSSHNFYSPNQTVFIESCPNLIT